MRRRILSCLMAVVMLLPICQVGAAAAGDQVKLSLSYPTGTAVGETFTVELLMEGNPGLLAAEVTLAYDKAVLECTKVKVGAALSGMFGATNPKASSGAKIACASATPVTGNGVAAIYTFKVLAQGAYGFALNDVALSDSQGNDLKVEILGGGTVDPPSGDSGKPSNPKPVDPTPPEEEEGSFTDTVGHWAESYIDRAVELGLVNGMGDGIYAPDSNMTRAHFVTILWREAGEPEPAGEASFTDLNPKQTYYHKAVAWAEENGVVNGVGNGLFAPDSNVTREQIATTLFRMEGAVPGAELMFYGIYQQAFEDSAQVSDWARPGVWWAVYHDIWCGTDQEEYQSKVTPKEAADRAQIAVMIVRYHEL